MKRIFLIIFAITLSINASAINVGRTINVGRSSSDKIRRAKEQEYIRQQQIKAQAMAKYKRTMAEREQKKRSSAERLAYNNRRKNTPEIAPTIIEPLYDLNDYELESLNINGEEYKDLKFKSLNLVNGEEMMAFFHSIGSSQILLRDIPTNISTTILMSNTNYVNVKKIEEWESQRTEEKAKEARRLSEIKYAHIREEKKMRIKKEEEGISTYDLIITQIIDNNTILASKTEYSYTKGYGATIQDAWHSQQRYVSGYIIFAIKTDSTKGLYDGKNISFNGKVIGTYSYIGTDNAKKTVQKIKALTSL